MSHATRLSEANAMFPVVRGAFAVPHKIPEGRGFAVPNLQRPQVRYGIPLRLRCYLTKDDGRTVQHNSGPVLS